LQQYSNLFFHEPYLSTSLNIHKGFLTFMENQLSTTFLFYNSIVIQNFRFMLHAILFSDFFDYPAWVSSRKAIARDILHNHTPRTNHAIIPYCHPGTDNYICSKPAIITYFNRFSLTHTLRNT